ncbi:MAG: zinc ribbon domain-containing protein [Actinobacteria bacterium]|nr:zinc ribbon domain-containing protein [Actinomycetota bacterium]
MHNNRLIGGLIILAGASLVIAGSILPWAKLETMLGSVTKSGTRGDGVITLIAGVIILVMGILVLAVEKYRFALALAAIGGFGCSLVAIIDLVDLANRTAGVNSEFASVKAGAGIYLVLAAGLVVISGVVVDRIGAPKESAQPVAAAPVSYACPYCGNPAKQTDRFCNHCGARFQQ